MESPIKTPEQLLKYRSLEQILAGTGRADPASMFAAAEMALRLGVDNRGRSAFLSNR